MFFLGKKLEQLLFLTFSVLVVNLTRELLYTVVVTPARGLLGREKRPKREGVWQHTYPPLYCSYSTEEMAQSAYNEENNKRRAESDASTACIQLHGYAGFGPSRARTEFLRLVN